MQPGNFGCSGSTGGLVKRPFLEIEVSHVETDRRVWAKKPVAVTGEAHLSPAADSGQMCKARAGKQLQKMTGFTPLCNLQQKVSHWAEMALLINNEFADAPEGFGFLVKGQTLICGFIDHFDLDKGDALTPPGTMPVFGEAVLEFSAQTDAGEVYRHIQQAAQYAAERWKLIE